MRYYISIFMVAILSGSSCHSDTGQLKINKATSVSESPKLERTVSEMDQSIRRIDFDNFIFDWYPKWASKNLKKPIALKDGEIEYSVKNNNHEGQISYVALVKTIYADLTFDNIEDAIIILEYGGTSSGHTNAIIIYTIKNKKPKFLWGIDTGTQAADGLRNVYKKAGNLIIESYTNKFISNTGEELKTGICCPVKYRQTTYHWDGNKFNNINEQLLDNEYKDARFIIND